MKVIDLTHTIREDMPVYPGTETPGLSPASSYEKDGFKETLLHMLFRKSFLILLVSLLSRRALKTIM